ncbi:hypothetical protein GCM10010405_09150 [Streptomyces macrosporus]|uniref:Uncharacterized protein n=1 Tax=Streptomyces macrosporus TaxID=44032 RepID=A0ABP5WJD0_9ACTN
MNQQVVPDNAGPTPVDPTVPCGSPRERRRLPVRPAVSARTVLDGVAAVPERTERDRHPARRHRVREAER